MKTLIITSILFYSYLASAQMILKFERLPLMHMDTGGVEMVVKVEQISGGIDTKLPGSLKPEVRYDFVIEDGKFQSKYSWLGEFPYYCSVKAARNADGKVHISAVEKCYLGDNEQLIYPEKEISIDASGRESIKETSQSKGNYSSPSAKVKEQ